VWRSGRSLSSCRSLRSWRWFCCFPPTCWWTAVYAAVRAARQRENWGFLAFQGAASIVTAVLAFLWPGLTVFAFVLLIAAWSIVTGCLMLAAAVRTEDGRWWLILGGAAATAFGILLILAPLAGAVVLTWWLGAFALVFGVALIILAFKLRFRFNNRSGRRRGSAGGMMPRSIEGHPRESAVARRKRRQQSADMLDATPSEQKIDESLEETFPASDPPNWTLLARIGSPKRGLPRYCRGSAPRRRNGRLRPSWSGDHVLAAATAGSSDGSICEYLVHEIDHIPCAELLHDVGAVKFSTVRGLIPSERAASLLEAPVMI
jgi:hypothetical protein